MYSIIMMIVMSGLSSACCAMDAEPAIPGPAVAAQGAGAPAGAGVGAGAPSGGGAGVGNPVASQDELGRSHEKFKDIWIQYHNLAKLPDPNISKLGAREIPAPSLVLANPDSFNHTFPVFTTEGERRKAYLVFGLALHPDKVGGKGLLEKTKDALAHLFKKLSEAMSEFNDRTKEWSDLLEKLVRREYVGGYELEPSVFATERSELVAKRERYEGALAAQKIRLKAERDWLRAGPFKRLNLKSEGYPHSGVGAEHGMVFNSKVHAPQLENNLPEIPAIPGPVTESPSERRKRESKNEKIREFNNARPRLLDDAKDRFIRRPKSTPRKYFERADAFGVNTGILGDVADVLSFDSQNAKVMAAGAAASVAGRSADAFYGRGAMSNSKTLEQERRLNRGLFGETEFNAEPTPPPAGENTEKAYKKADRRYEADQVSAGVSMLERQVAQPVLALYDHTNVALNAKATLAYNKFLAQNKNKPAVQKYLRRLRAKKGAIFAMMALETFLKSGAHWAHTRRETDPVVENPTKKDSKVVSNANTMAALGAAVGIARRGLTTYVKHKHVSAANDHADSLYDTDKENASEDDDMPVHQAVAGMTR
ncbi:MAG: hypothetical protein WCJ17_00200 [bacterium]